MAVLSTIKTLQDDCYVKNRRYCSLEELQLATLRQWGEIQVQSPTYMRFEGWDVQLLLTDAHYCTAAFPTRLPKNVEAEWHDDTGRSYWVKYPWLDVPRTCDLPNRTKLLVE
jgi:hypothetical protein